MEQNGLIGFPVQENTYNPEVLRVPSIQYLNFSSVSNIKVIRLINSNTYDDINNKINI